MVRSPAQQDKWIESIFFAVATTSMLIVVLIFLFIIKEAFPFLLSPELKTFFSASWNPTSVEHLSYGILPLMSGSLLVTILAIVIAVPLSLGAAVYIAEMATPAEKKFLKPLIELLAGIPSVVIGFFGIMVLAPFLKEVFHLQSGLTALTGGILLALMAAPTIMTISEEAIRSVPAAYKEGSLAIGATHHQTIWKVIVPAAMPGIIAAIMLGIGRVIGETMAVLMVTGNAAILTFSPVESVRTMTATIAAEMGEVSFSSQHYQALFCVGVVLLSSTFVLNLIARQILKQYRRHA